MLAIRALALWQVYLGAGRAAVARSTCGCRRSPAAARSSTCSGSRRSIAILVGVRRYQPASRGPWRWFARRLRCCSGSATSTPTATRGCSAPRCRSRRSATAPTSLVYPALMAGLLMLVRRRNPERDRAGRHRLADHDARPRAALVGRADRAVPARRRRSSTVAKLVSIAYPLGDILLLAAAIRLAVDTGTRQPGVLPAGARASSRCSSTDFAYGLVTLARRLRRPGRARRRLDQLLPAVGRRGAAPVDARARASRARPRRRASRRCASRC